MEIIKFPYCDCKIRMADVDANDGVCPECGAPLMGSQLFDQDGAEDELTEESPADSFGDARKSFGIDGDDDDLDDK